MRLGNLGLDHLETVVVDEADLMCTYMYAEAIQKLWKRMPEHYQLFVASATMSQAGLGVFLVFLKKTKKPVFI